LQNGETPLYIAVLNGHQDIARLLLKAGSNPFQKCVNGETPYEIAVAQNCRKLCELMRPSNVQNGSWFISHILFHYLIMPFLPSKICQW